MQYKVQIQPHVVGTSLTGPTQSRCSKDLLDEQGNSCVSTQRDAQHCHSMNEKWWPGEMGACRAPWLGDVSLALQLRCPCFELVHHCHWNTNSWWEMPCLAPGTLCFLCHSLLHQRELKLNTNPHLDLMELLNVRAILCPKQQAGQQESE